MPSAGQGVGLCPLCGREHDAATAVCTECAIATAEGKLAEEHAACDERLADNDRAHALQPGRMRAALIAACVVCALIVAARIPSLISSAAALPPIRTGSYTTAGRCDACVENLWRFGAAMQSGAAAPSGLTCPATSTPYRVEKSADAVSALVSCPNPANHDLTSLTVSGSSPIPEAR
jgi:hypothetical protein